VSVDLLVMPINEGSVDDSLKQLVSAHFTLAFDQGCQGEHLFRELSHALRIGSHIQQLHNSLLGAPSFPRRGGHLKVVEVLEVSDEDPFAPQHGFFRGFFHPRDCFLLLVA